MTEYSNKLSKILPEELTSLTPQEELASFTHEEEYIPVEWTISVLGALLPSNPDVIKAQQESLAKSLLRGSKDSQVPVMISAASVEVPSGKTDRGAGYMCRTRINSLLDLLIDVQRCLQDPVTLALALCLSASDSEYGKNIQDYIAVEHWNNPTAGPLGDQIQLLTLIHHSTEESLKLCDFNVQPEVVRLTWDEWEEKKVFRNYLSASKKFYPDQDFHSPDAALPELRTFKYQFYREDDWETCIRKSKTIKFVQSPYYILNAPFQKNASENRPDKGVINPTETVGISHLGLELS